MTWQPIATAPMNGESVIVAVRCARTRRGWIVGEAWFDNDEIERTWWWAGTNRWDIHATSVDVGEGPPTHWQPLPPPPTEETTR